MTLASLAFSIASKYLGEKEATGENDGAFVESIQRWMDGGAGWMKGKPWCAAFASWCIAQAGSELNVTPRLPKSASTSDLFAWYQKEGLRLFAPALVVPCIGMVRGDGGEAGKTHHHTFFVERVDGGYVSGIDGNLRNAVSKSIRSIADCDFGPIV